MDSVSHLSKAYLCPFRDYSSHILQITRRFCHILSLTALPPIKVLQKVSCLPCQKMRKSIKPRFTIFTRIFAHFSKLRTMHINYITNTTERKLQIQLRSLVLSGSPTLLCCCSKIGPPRVPVIFPAQGLRTHSFFSLKWC